jgi:RNA polymerase sigma factor (sigma-70 family)
MMYLSSLKHYKIRLSKSEEIELMDRYHRGDLAAQTILIESILPWIIKIAKKFKNCGLDFDDIVQMGSLGVVQSLVNFDPNRARLSTYATAAAIFEIQRGINKNGVIRVPRTALISSNPKTKELAQRAKSLQFFSGSESDNIAEKVDIVDEPITSKDLRKLRDAIDSLDPRLALLIKWRLKGKSLEEIGDELKVSKERARQLEIKALAALQLAMGQPDRFLSSLKSIIRGATPTACSKNHERSVYPQIRVRDNREVVRYSRRGIKIGKN